MVLSFHHFAEHQYEVAELIIARLTASLFSWSETWPSITIFQDLIPAGGQLLRHHDGENSALDIALNDQSVLVGTLPPAPKMVLPPGGSCHHSQQVHPA